ncbi:TatD family hydrolase [Reichenbachiella agarivorans]|uniref:TatD family hydrolase n=1 Tax=Reichenbachiella agarivorans TaxID=2979464 RepID=A0ABY6CT18_9BACT|nr:TatD family hydrolase [Reichenbachiella agarivorans]UXP32603.1 TatD family hydrolase [Reichenbachiella agarivorans]
MNHNLFQDNHFLDFHTHHLRHVDRDDVTEIVSIHMGKERAHQYFTIGIHPWWIEQLLTSTQSDELKLQLSDPHCLAMGEIGLDNTKGPSLKIQTELFKSLLHLAEDLKKPVVIHCVRAFDQLIKIKKEFPLIPNWCVHGFGRHAILARQLVDQGFYLSLMPNMPSSKYEDIIKSVPLDRIFLETDSMPDVNIEEIYFRISKLSGIEISDLCRQLNRNAREFFKI